MFRVNSAGDTGASAWSLSYLESVIWCNTEVVESDSGRCSRWIRCVMVRFGGDQTQATKTSSYILAEPDFHWIGSHRWHEHLF